ncbi:hypothetical protein ABH931_007585 [Streptacidiphilus sp. MAP12-33]|uniref:hypothetical protein n=1 Tax=Streptacidiphilus sp. MAP12-33 TaxID=3156266 RepID=UPI003518A8CF
MTNTRPGELDTAGETTQRQPSDAAPPSRRAAVGAIALALLSFAVAATAIVAWPGARAAYDSGLAGHPGAFVATRCWATPEGRSVEHRCTGTFTARLGGIVLHDQTLWNTPARAGHSLDVTLEPGGGYAVERPSHVMFDLALCLLLLGMAVGTLILIGDAPRKRAGSRRLYGHQPWLGLACTGMLGFPLLMLLAALTAVAAVVTVLSGN